MKIDLFDQVGGFYDNGKKKTGGEYERVSMKGVDVEKPIEVEVGD